MTRFSLVMLVGRTRRARWWLCAASTSAGRLPFGACPAPDCLSASAASYDTEQPASLVVLEKWRCQERRRGLKLCPMSAIPCPYVSQLTAAREQQLAQLWIEAHPRVQASWR